MFLIYDIVIFQESVTLGNTFNIYKFHNNFDSEIAKLKTPQIEMRIVQCSFNIVPNMKRITTTHLCDKDTGKVVQIRDESMKYISTVIQFACYPELIFCSTASDKYFPLV